MLNFRSELSKIKEDKLNRADLQERVEVILRDVLKYFEKISLKRLNTNEFKVSFFLDDMVDSKFLSTYVKDASQYINIRNDTLETREDAIKTFNFIKEYFVKQEYKIYEDVARKYSFAIRINA